MRVIKRYELIGFNACQTHTEYCGVKVNLNFEDGNIVAGKSATLQTDNQFAQDAIENDPRFKSGSIRLVSTINADEPEKKKVEKKPEEVEVVNDVKTINDANSWLEEHKGVTLEKSTKAYVAKVCADQGVSFPNLQLRS